MYEQFSRVMGNLFGLRFHTEFRAVNSYFFLHSFWKEKTVFILMARL